MSQEIDSRDIFLKGKHVFLKALTREDAITSDWYGWFNDEELCNTLQKHYFPSTCESQVNFWEQNIFNASNKIQLGVCPLKGGPIIGIVSLNDIDFINRKAEFSAVIGDRKSQNVTIFKEACKLLFRHGFNSLNLNRIYGGSISNDLVMLMCRILNCKREGVLRQEIYKNGMYHDSYLYSVLREDFIHLSLD